MSLIEHSEHLKVTQLVLSSNALAIQNLVRLLEKTEALESNDEVALDVENPCLGLLSQ